MRTEREISDKELRRWIALAKEMLWQPRYRQQMEEAGICLTPARFYNQIPLLSELENGFENTEAIPYDLPFLSRERLVETIDRLSRFNSEFSPPEEAGEGFRWKNGAFSFADAMSYYCFVRMLSPKTVLEIGSGFSTLVALEAAGRNDRTEIICVEPFPMDMLKSADIRLIENKVQDLDAEFFNDTLADGDILFIDSTHTVKASSDCCHIYLRILPKIVRNIVVHVHDVLLPRSISVRKAIDSHIYWTEQHLMSAYLLDNPKIEFLFGSAYAKLVARQELDSFMQGKSRSGGGSFWFALNGNRSTPADREA